jgi:hypothetical protein
MAGNQPACAKAAQPPVADRFGRIFEIFRRISIEFSSDINQDPSSLCQPATAGQAITYTYDGPACFEVVI